MPGDYSRFTDDLKKRFSKLFMQQGKVQLDADWNELVEILTRRDRLQAFDTFGPAVVPATTEEGFHITSSGTNLLIGAGRMYVDGVLAEAFDQDGKNNQPLSYASQPFFVDPPPAPAGRGLLYLDVWERELTSVEEPSLLEPALGGVDTSTRMQTVWQVKYHKNASVHCDSDLNDLFKPSDCLLTVDITPPGDDPDPCLLPQTGGFQDVENRHYRVEIHDASLTPPTFKFARDPVVTEIDAMPSANVLSVRRTGRDPVLRFAKGDYAEVVNDRHVLHELPGRIVKVDFVDDALQEITVVDAGFGDVHVNDVKPELHPRLVRWDQKTAPVLQATGTVALEVGIQVKFEGGTRFHNGDYWTFPARAVTRKVGPLVKELPRGIRHHYAALAQFDDAFTPPVISDCRVPWPPECDCECAACVTPEHHRTGKFTIQMAIDLVKKKGGGKVCLKPGIYLFDKPLQIVDNDTLWLTGHGKVVLSFIGDARDAILVENCMDVTIEGIFLVRSAVTSSGADGCAITVNNCWMDIVIQNCLIWTPSFDFTDKKFVFDLSRGVCVALHGSVFDVRVKDCDLLGGIGVGMVGGKVIARPRTLTFARAEILDNLIAAGEIGVMLHAIGMTVVARNNFIDSGQNGIWLDGTTEPVRLNIIDENMIHTGRVGIAVSADQTTISNNVVQGTYDPANPGLTDVDGTYSGIAIYTETNADELTECQILGNHCSRLKGQGIQVAGRAIGLMIKQNFVREIAGAGIIVTEKANGSEISIENNELFHTSLSTRRLSPNTLAVAAAIDIGSLCITEIATNNIVMVNDRFPDLPCAGILVLKPASTRIHENRIDLRSHASRPLGGNFPAAIDIVGPAIADVTNNVVITAALSDNSYVHALRIQEAFPFHGCFAFRLPFHAAELVPDGIAKPGIPPTGGKPGRFDRQFSSYAILWWDQYLWFRPVLPGNAPLIRSNQFRTAAVTSNRDFYMVEIADSNAGCTFGGNVCVADPQLLICGAHLFGVTAVVDSNQVFGTLTPVPTETRGNSINIELTNPDSNEWTVLGNITEGSIRVNGATLPSPWSALNRTA